MEAAGIDLADNGRDRPIARGGPDSGRRKRSGSGRRKRSGRDLLEPGGEPLLQVGERAASEPFAKIELDPAQAFGHNHSDDLEKGDQPAKNADSQFDGNGVAAGGFQFDFGRRAGRAGLAGRAVGGGLLLALSARLLDDGGQEVVEVGGST